MFFRDGQDHNILGCQLNYTVGVSSGCRLILKSGVSAPSHREGLGMGLKGMGGMGGRGRARCVG